MTTDLIGPLTAEEWCSLRLGADDDPLQCCAYTSELRDGVFQLLRIGGDRHWGDLLHVPWIAAAKSHDMADLLTHPLVGKLHAYYIEGQPEPPSDRDLAELQATDPGYLCSLSVAIPAHFDLGTEEGRLAALGRVAPEVAHVPDGEDRARRVDELARLLSMPLRDVALVVDAWRANVGLPVGVTA